MATLARLSFRVPVPRLDDFEALFDRQLAPVLGPHGLAPSSEAGRRTRPEVCSRLLELGRPDEVASRRQALEQDAAWQAAVRAVGERIGGNGPDGGLPWALALYQAPAGPGQSVPLGPGLRQGLWQSFGAEDGLPIRDITAILQDRQGSLWVATEGQGIFRHDGAVVTAFTAADGLASDRVWALAEDGQGRLWCGTEQGLSCGDGQTWTAYTSADGLADDSVRCLLADGRGRLWCGTTQGLSCFDGAAWTQCATPDGPLDTTVLALLEDRQGRLWWATAQGLNCSDGEAWTTYTTAHGLTHNRVTALAEDDRGRIWCGSSISATRCFDGRLWRVAPPAEGAIPDRVLSIAAGGQGRLWFATLGAGVWEREGTRVTQFTVVDGLANNLARVVTTDQAGDLWVGTDTGMSRYCRAQFLTLTARDGLATDAVTGIGEDRQGRIWLGTSGGRVSRLEGTELTTLTLPTAGGAHSTWAIREDRQGRIWFATMFAVFCCDGQRFVQRPAGPAPGGDQGCRALCEDRAGHVWAGSGMWWAAEGTGLHRYDGAGWTTYTTADGLASDLVCALAEDQQGRLWAGGGHGGLTVLDGGRMTPVDGLPPCTVTSMTADGKGRLWAGTRGGGAWSWDSSAVSAAEGAAGLAPLAVEGRTIYPVATAVVVDRDGRLWIGTYGGGVYLYDGQVLQRLSRKDGLVHDGVQALHQDRNGDVWIGTEGGVTRYRPRHAPPAVRLTDAIADRRYGPVSELEVPAYQKLVAFAFEGRSWTTRPEAMAFVYRLHGHDEAWRTAYGGWAEYHDLPVGKYTFQVRAVDRDLNYSEPATVALHLVPDPRIEALSQAFASGTERFVGRSPALERVQLQLAQAAPTDLTLLILGETGTGKGLAARIAHQLSPQRSGPLLPVSCGGIPPALLESEMFGHERGAFTGAVARKLGKVELAQGGILFLDEIGDLPAEGQAKLLRLLEERTFERVGGTRTLTAQVRVIAATNRDLAAMVQAGHFREDLYYRLQGFTVWLPPLRERQEDIPELALYFAARMASHLNRRVDGFDAAAMAALTSYRWPGNVRELEHAVKRAVVVATSPVLQAADLALGPAGADGVPTDNEFGLSPKEYEKRFLLRLMERTHWVIRGPQGAAARLGTSPSTLRDRLKRLGIVRPKGR